MFGALSLPSLERRYAHSGRLQTQELFPLGSRPVGSEYGNPFGLRRLDEWAGSLFVLGIVVTAPPRPARRS